MYLKPLTQASNVRDKTDTLRKMLKFLQFVQDSVQFLSRKIEGELPYSFLKTRLK
ncbi:hypothetical protein TDB9533_04657 [Thalassocella blandensis]|nr:hypothetical protein TDB9533_04657 [Thalassocella blandensis]